MLLKEPLLIFSTAAATRTSPFFCGVCRPFHSLTPSADGNLKLGHFIFFFPFLLVRPCQRTRTRIWCSTALRTRYTGFTHGFNAVRPAYFFITGTRCVVTASITINYMQDLFGTNIFRRERKKVKLGSKVGVVPTAPRAARCSSCPSAR